MPTSEQAQPRFRSRLKKLFHTLSDDLNIIKEGMLTFSSEAPAAQNNTAQATTGDQFAQSENSTHESLENDSYIQSSEELEAQAAEERMDLDRQQFAQWQEAIDEICQARTLRKSRHPAVISDSFQYIENLIQSARSKEIEASIEVQTSDSGDSPSLAEQLAPAEEVENSLPQPREWSEYNKPSFDLLRPMPEGALDFINETEVERQKNDLQDAIDSFAIDALVYDAVIGPRVTQFRVKPGFGVRVETIAALERNIALALKVRAVRIQAPIPGEPFVGIEVPNGNSLPLTLRSAFESRSWAESKADIPLALGMDITGRIVICDLAKAPHALIAGATGSGKSVCISNIILSLLYRFRPDELELVLVDPKKVEFALYKDLPHLIHPVVSDAKEACATLKWLVREMESRYDTLSKRKVRNLAGYNAKAIEEGFPKMPYIVLIVDELADLMMTAKEDVETPIARLAQMSRAVGIHTILATQRPSVNIITGVIKANFPTRIAFQVSSQIDSRTILDGKGAESLQGKGDMLYTPPGIGKLMRIQAPFVDDDEINLVTETLKAQSEPSYRVALKSDDPDEPSFFPEEGEDSDVDPLIKQSVEIISTTGKASTSYLQRKLRIGYNRAARLMEELEDRGYVGPQIGSNPREILVEPGEYQL